MPVLFQLLQSISFALSFSARNRHVALGLRSAWNCGVFAGEYCKGYPGQSQSQSDQQTKINESAFAESLSSRSRGASEEAMANISGARGAFFFHYWNWVCVKRILEESRHCPPRFARGEYFGFKKPQNAGKTVLAVGPNLVKLFLMVNSKYLVAALVAEKPDL